METENKTIDDEKRYKLMVEVKMRLEDEATSWANIAQAGMPEAAEEAEKNRSLIRKISEVL